MRIFINDHETHCPENISLKELLETNDIPLINIAVAIDSTIVPKAQWNSWFVEADSKIMIIKAVQGG